MKLGNLRGSSEDSYRAGDERLVGIGSSICSNASGSRASEIRETDATAAAVARLERDGIVMRLSQGLYQLADSPTDVHHALAKAALLVPKGVARLLPLPFESDERQGHPEASSRPFAPRA